MQLGIDVVVGVVSLAAIAADPGTPGPGTPLVIAVISVWGFFLGLPYAAGRAVGSRTQMNAELRTNAERLEREQRDRAREAVTGERTRIARELHDVVAHGVSVMVIQTQAARRVADRGSAAAVEALRAVESCGRDALVDMRRMIGVLHRGDVELLGASLGYANLARFMFGYGTISWLIFGTVVLVRLFGRPALATPLRPTLAILVAPPAVAGNAGFAMKGSRTDPIALFLAGFAVLMVLMQLRLTPVFRSVPFGPGS